VVRPVRLRVGVTPGPVGALGRASRAVRVVADTGRMAALTVEPSPVGPVTVQEVAATAEATRVPSAAGAAGTAVPHASPPVVAVPRVTPRVVVRAAPMVAVRAVPEVEVRRAAPMVVVRVAPMAVVRMAPVVAVRAAPGVAEAVADRPAVDEPA